MDMSLYLIIAFEILIEFIMVFIVKKTSNAKIWNILMGMIIVNLISILLIIVFSSYLYNFAMYLVIFWPIPLLLFFITHSVLSVVLMELKTKRIVDKNKIDIRLLLLGLIILPVNIYYFVFIPYMNNA